MPPIKPSQVAKRKRDTTPEFVYDAFNNLIVKHWDGNESRFLHEDVIAEILKLGQEAGNELTRQDVFDNKWLEVEPAFRKAGWGVEYDSPAYCESYPAKWIFSK